MQGCFRSGSWCTLWKATHYSQNELRTGIKLCDTADCPSSHLCLRLPPSHHCWLQTELWQQLLCAADKPQKFLLNIRCATPGAWRSRCLFSSYWPHRLPDPSSGPQAAAIGIHVSNPTSSPTAPCWSEDSDRGAHLSPGAVYRRQLSEAANCLPQTLPPQQTSHRKLVVLKPSNWTRPAATDTLWVCSFTRVHKALCVWKVFTWTRSERYLHQLWNSQPLAPHLEGPSLAWN